jgi:hypothetical protein
MKRMMKIIRAKGGSHPLVAKRSLTVQDQQPTGQNPVDTV